MSEVKFDNAKDFAVAVNMLAEAPPALVSRIKRKAMLLVLTGVVLRTPVAETINGITGGTARNNWQVHDNTPLETVRVGKDTSGQATIQRNSSIIARLAPYSKSFISNNIRYIGVLEYGLYPRPGSLRVTDIFTPFGAITKSVHRSALGGKVTAEGYSKQAPHGMLRVTLEELKEHLPGIISREIAAFQSQRIDQAIRTSNEPPEATA